MVKIITTSKINAISRGGDHIHLGKSGSGPRAKMDAVRNAKKTGSRSIFVEGFTHKRQYPARPIDKPLPFRNGVKIKENPFYENRGGGGCGNNPKPPKS